MQFLVRLTFSFEHSLRAHKKTPKSQSTCVAVVSHHAAVTAVTTQIVCKWKVRRAFQISGYHNTYSLWPQIAQEISIHLWCDKQQRFHYFHLNLQINRSQKQKGLWNTLFYLPVYTNALLQWTLANLVESKPWNYSMEIGGKLKEK